MLDLCYTKIVNWRVVCYVPNPDAEKSGIDMLENPFNFTMGVFMMHTGIQSITHKNAAEFYMRAKLIETCFGSLFTNGDGTPHHLTTDDVFKYIGLSSNISSWTRPQFFAHLRTNVIRNLTETMQAKLRHEDEAIRERVLATAEADPELRKLT